MVLVLGASVAGLSSRNLEIKKLLLPLLHSCNMQTLRLKEDRFSNTIRTSRNLETSIGSLVVWSSERRFVRLHHRSRTTYRPGNTLYVLSLPWNCLALDKNPTSSCGDGVWLSQDDQPKIVFLQQSLEIYSSGDVVHVSKDLLFRAPIIIRSLSGLYKDLTDLNVAWPLYLFFCRDDGSNGSWKLSTRWFANSGIRTAPQ